MKLAEMSRFVTLLKRNPSMRPLRDGTLSLARGAALLSLLVFVMPPASGAAAAEPRPKKLREVKDLAKASTFAVGVLASTNLYTMHVHVAGLVDACQADLYDPPRLRELAAKTGRWSALVDSAIKPLGEFIETDEERQSYDELMQAVHLVGEEIKAMQAFVESRGPESLKAFRAAQEAARVKINKLGDAAIPPTP
jgi:hypothetical protein